MWPPAGRRDRHRDVWYLRLFRSALPCITHENNATTLKLEQFLASGFLLLTIGSIARTFRRQHPSLRH
jgi:hypothetical protein